MSYQKIYHSEKIVRMWCDRAGYAHPQISQRPSGSLIYYQWWAIPPGAVLPIPITESIPKQELTLKQIVFRVASRIANKILDFLIFRSEN